MVKALRIIKFIPLSLLFMLGFISWSYHFRLLNRTIEASVVLSLLISFCILEVIERLIFIRKNIKKKIKQHTF